MNFKILPKSAILFSIVFLMSQSVFSQWALPGTTTHSTSNPEIEKINPKLIFDNSDNAVSGLQFNSGSTIHSTFGFWEFADKFVMDNDLDIDGSLKIGGTTVVKEGSSSTVMEFGPALGLNKINHFPSRIGINTTLLGSNIDLGIDGGASTKISMMATAENILEFDQGINKGYIKMIGDYMEFRNNTGDTEFTKSNLGEPQMIIKNNGKIGIGTDTPSQALEVNGIVNINSSFNTALQIDGKEAIWWNPTSNHISWGFGSDYNYFADEVRIGGTGSSGAPTYQLEVIGNADVCGELTAKSDKRLKDEIMDVDNALETLDKLRPRSYKFRTEEYPNMGLAEGEKMGFIAQELERILPELVSTGSEVTNTSGETFNSKSVNYIALIPLLTKAIQEQQQMIKALQVELLASR